MSGARPLTIHFCQPRRNSRKAFRRDRSSKPCQWSFAGSFRDTFWSRMKPSIFGLWGESPSPRKERERLDLEVVAATSDEPTWKTKMFRSWSVSGLMRTSIDVKWLISMSSLVVQTYWRVWLIIADCCPMFAFNKNVLLFVCWKDGFLEWAFCKNVIAVIDSLPALEHTEAWSRGDGCNRCTKAFPRWGA
jgi:hypothetical protein